MEYKVKKYEKGVYGVTLEDEIGTIIMESPQTFATELEAEVFMKRIRTWGQSFDVTFILPNGETRKIAMPFVPQRKSVLEECGKIFEVDLVCIDITNPNTCNIWMKSVKM